MLVPAVAVVGVCDASRDSSDRAVIGFVAAPGFIVRGHPACYFQRRIVEHEPLLSTSVSCRALQMHFANSATSIVMMVVRTRWNSGSQEPVAFHNLVTPRALHLTQHSWEHQHPQHWWGVMVNT